MSKAVKVGIFVVVGIATFCIGLFLIGSRKQLFSHHFIAYVRFRNVNTLQTGSMVRVGGMDAGKVVGIAVPSSPPSKFRLKLTIDKKFASIVRRNSTATIRSEGMVGNKFVSIKAGSSDSPRCAPSCTLPSKRAASMSSLMRQGNKLAKQLHGVIGDLQHHADKALENISGAAGHAKSLIASIQPNVVGITRNANAIVAGIHQGDGVAGKLLSNKKVAANVVETIGNAKQTTANFKQTSATVDNMVDKVQRSDMPAVHQTLKNAQRASHRINTAIKTILAKGKNSDSTAVAIRNTVHSAQKVSANLADDTDAIKHNFFFRGFFHRRGYFDLRTLTPETYARSKFVKQPTVRVWVHAAGMFEVGAKGALRLTEDGRASVDAAMSQLVAYLPHNPVVVEGYALTNTASRSYILSKKRALAVRHYLLTQYYLNPSRIGIMPMGSHPPPHAGRRTWNGICLVLVRWKK